MLCTNFTISSGGRSFPFINAVLTSVLFAMVVLKSASVATDMYQNPIICKSCTTTEINHPADKVYTSFHYQNLPQLILSSPSLTTTYQSQHNNITWVYLVKVWLQRPITVEIFVHNSPKHCNYYTQIIFMEKPV